MDRVLRNTAATVTVTFYNGSNPVDADTDPSVVAKKADGTTLFSTTATNETDPGVYSVVIPGQAALNILTLTWTGLFTGTPVVIESVVEIVGGFYFSIAELRGYDSALGNVNRFTTDDLVEARAYVETEFEDICGRAFVPRYYREQGLVYDDGSLWVEKPEPIVFTSITADGINKLSWYTDGYLKRDKYAPNALRLNNDSWSAAYATQIDAEYEYGMKRVPLPIKEKALKRAKQRLIGMNSTMDERATTMLIPDVGQVNLATPGLRGSTTGVPDIDVVLARYTIDGGAGVY